MAIITRLIPAGYPGRPYGSFAGKEFSQAYGTYKYWHDGAWVEVHWKHKELKDIGVNTHAQIDTFISDNPNIHVASGQTIGGGTGTVGLAYYLTATEDTWLLSDKATEATVSGKVGVCSAPGTIMFRGLVTLTAHGLGPNGTALYVGTTGAITTAFGLDSEFGKIIGTIEDANTIRVGVDEDYDEYGTPTWQILEALGVSGQTIDGGTGTVGLAYYLTATDDTWLPSDKAVEATVSGKVGVCLEANTIIFAGIITLMGHGLGANGTALYVGTTGAITASFGIDDEFGKIVGTVEDANTIRVYTDEDYDEYGAPSWEIAEALGVSGQTIDGGAGTIGLAYYLTSTDDTWLPADKTTETTVSGKVGVCLKANTIIFAGIITLMGHGLGANGTALYVGTAGAITASFGLDSQFGKIVGTVEDANTIRVYTDEDYDEYGIPFGGNTRTLEVSADYTILDTDGYRRYLVTTGASDITVTLPTLLNNQDRIIEIVKVDSGAGTVIVDGKGSETINGELTYIISFQYSDMPVHAGPNEWGIGS